MGCDGFKVGKRVVPLRISIHAPRVGCDSVGATPVDLRSMISIHAPRVGCDGGVYLDVRTYYGFQSTHPVWGATV